MLEKPTETHVHVQLSVSNGLFNRKFSSKSHLTALEFRRSSAFAVVSWTKASMLNQTNIHLVLNTMTSSALIHQLEATELNDVYSHVTVVGFYRWDSHVFLSLPVGKIASIHQTSPSSHETNSLIQQVSFVSDIFSST